MSVEMRPPPLLSCAPCPHAPGPHTGVLGHVVGGLLALLAAVALTASACTNHPVAPGPADVLGQPHGTPLVRGEPAPGLVGELGAVACADTQRCWAVGVPGPNATMPAGDSTVIVATTNGGATWSPQTVAGGYTPELSGIACPTRTDCLAVGSNGSSSGVVVVTHDGGAHWDSATTPTGAIAVESLLCDGLTECTALVSNGTAVWSARTTDFGQTWTQLGNLPSSFVADGALSCVPGGACLVPGYTPTSAGHGQGALAVSSDGGQTWADATVPSSTGVLQAAECPTTSLCLASGSTSTTVSDVSAAQGELLASTDGGMTWTAANGTADRRRLRDGLPDTATLRPGRGQLVGQSGRGVRCGGAEPRRRHEPSRSPRRPTPRSP